MSGKYLECPYTNDPCCMRTGWGACRVLADTRFKDNKCHFRKETTEGPNAYDEARLFWEFLGNERIQELLEDRRQIYIKLREIESDIRYIRRAAK